MPVLHSLQVGALDVFAHEAASARPGVPLAARTHERERSWKGQQGPPRLLKCGELLQAPLAGCPFHEVARHREDSWGSKIKLVKSEAQDLECTFQEVRDR